MSRNSTRVFALLVSVAAFLTLLATATVSCAAAAANSSISLSGWCEGGVFAVSHTVPVLVALESSAVIHAHGCHMDNIVDVRAPLNRIVRIISTSPTLVVLELPNYIGEGRMSLTFYDHLERKQVYNDLIFVVKSEVVNASPALFVPSVAQEATFYFNFLVPGTYEVKFGPYNTTVLSMTPSALTVLIAPSDTVVYDVSVVVLLKRGQTRADTVAIFPPAGFPISPPLSAAVSRIEPSVIISDQAYKLKIHGVGLLQVTAIEVGSTLCSFDLEDKKNTDVLLHCRFDPCPLCARGHIPVTFTRLDSLTFNFEITIIDAEGRSPYDPFLPPNGELPTDDSADTDIATHIYIAVTDYASLFPFYTAAVSYSVLPRVLSHNHPPADTAVVWSDYYYRVDFSPGSFDPKLPLAIFWGLLRLPFYELDNMGFSVLIPRCSFNEDTEQYTCPGGKNAFITALLSGVDAPMFLPDAAQTIVNRRTRGGTTDTHPLLLHHVSPSVAECGDEVIVTVRTHGELPVPAQTALFIPDSAPAVLLEALSRSDCGQAEGGPKGDVNEEGGCAEEGHRVPDELLARVTPESLAQAVADQGALDAAAGTTVGAFSRPSAAVVAAADPIASLFNLVRSSNKSLVLPASELDSLAAPITPLLSTGAETTVLSAIRFAVDHAFVAKVERLPSPSAARFSLPVVASNGFCKPTMTDMFVLSSDQKLLDVLYTSPGRRLRVIQKPFFGLRVGFVWSTPFPSRPAERENLVNRVLGVLSSALTDHSPERIIALGIDVDASVLYLGFLPRHRNQSPTPVEMAAELDAILADPTSVVRQHLPDLNPDILVPRVKLIPCPSPSTHPDSIEIRYELSCSAPSDETPPSMMLWYFAAAGGVVLLAVVGAGCQYRYGCLRRCSCARCCNECSCCRPSEAESPDAFVDDIDVEGTEVPPSMYNANSSYYHFD